MHGKGAFSSVDALHDSEPYAGDRLRQLKQMRIKNMYKYEVLEMEVIEFDTEDIITTSGGDIKLPEVPISGNN